MYQLQTYTAMRYSRPAHLEHYCLSQFSSVNGSRILQHLTSCAVDGLLKLLNQGRRVVWYSRAQVEWDDDEECEQHWELREHWGVFVIQESSIPLLRPLSPRAIESK